jgi:hypothetical protein
LDASTSLIDTPARRAMTDQPSPSRTVAVAAHDAVRFAPAGRHNRSPGCRSSSVVASLASSSAVTPTSARAATTNQPSPGRTS